MNSEIIKSLMRCPLFRGFDEPSIEDALYRLGCHIEKYSKGETLLSEGRITEELGIVLSGSVQIERVDYTGARNLLSQAEKNMIFAESYALQADEPMLVDVTANADCRIAFLRISRLQDTDLAVRGWYQKIVMNLLTVSSRKNLELSRRNFHTSPRRARGRILSYLTEQAQRAGKNEFDISFNREQLADYLNLDRSALSRELSAMQSAGLLNFRKNHFVLLEE